jgi:flagellar biosynthesis protein FlhG
MLAVNKISAKELQEIRTACAYLFSADHASDNAFLETLDINRVEEAFVNKTKQNNPYVPSDEPAKDGMDPYKYLSKLRDSLGLLRGCLTSEKTKYKPGLIKEPKVIAVGGAKGGIGKSLFSANLGIFLASSNHRVVLIDLDLGCSNLHYHLGVKSVAHSVDDFLNKLAPNLNLISIPTRYGPHLIGGSSSELGSANIAFARKLKLIEAIRKIEADYVILDLGGDTSYNIIDFFLSADFGLVLSTCEPAAYVGAYNFIKIALHRRLNRIGSIESPYRKKVDAEFKQLVKDSSEESQLTNGNFILNLMQNLERYNHGYLALLEQVLHSFTPKLILNMVSPQNRATHVTHRLQETARGMLSINVDFLTNIPFTQEVKDSVIDLVPPVVKHPDGILANAIRQSCTKLGLV